MQAFLFPSYGREHTSGHVPVATAEFLVNFRTHQICLSRTDSDNAILQRKSETTHVSNFQRLLHSQPVGLELLVELLTHGADLPADILADARDCASDVFEALNLLH